METDTGADEKLRDELARDVFAHFGVAFYYAQVVEEALAGLLLVSHVPRRQPVSRKHLDELDSWARGSTMGTLMNRVVRELNVDGHLQRSLRGALSVRNQLAHGYFSKRAAAHCTVAGSERMIGELRAWRGQFQDLNDQLHSLLLEIASPFLTEEMIDAAVAAETAAVERGVDTDEWD